MRRLYNRFSYRREPLNLNDKQFELWLQFVRRADESGTQVRVFLAAIAGGGLAAAIALLSTLGVELVRTDTSECITLIKVIAACLFISVVLFAVSFGQIYCSWNLQKEKSLTRRKIVARLNPAKSTTINAQLGTLLSCLDDSLFPKSDGERKGCCAKIKSWLARNIPRLSKKSEGKQDSNSSNCECNTKMKTISENLTGLNLSCCDLSKLKNENNVADKSTAWLLALAFILLFVSAGAAVVALAGKDSTMPGATVNFGVEVTAP